MDSVYKKLDKLRKPRVQISYDLEDGGQTVKKELPFVVGVMGDYSGHSSESSRAFKDRKFIQIDGENFNNVMGKMRPELSIKVNNTLSEADEEMAVDLKFNTMEDFEPDNVAKQVPALNRLLEIRSQLRDLLSKADRSEDLESMLEQIMQDELQLKTMADELGHEKIDSKEDESATDTKEKEDE
jgi:type VI secretion system protein ImpB